MLAFAIGLAGEPDAELMVSCVRRGRAHWVRVAALIATLLLAAACAPPARSSAVALHVLPEAGDRPILRALGDARRSIELEVYLLTHSRFLDELKSARGRDVRVRVLLEQRPFGEASNEAAFARLTRDRVEVRWTAPTLRYTHAKTLLVDRESAWIMTANLTRAAFLRNREYLLVMTDRGQVDELGAIFDADWEQVAPGAAIQSLVISPVNARARVFDLIDAANESLDVAAEELVDLASVERLVAAARRGIAVRLLMPEPDGSRADPSRPGQDALAAAGGQVRRLAAPYPHAKLILVDRRRAFVGSVNFSRQSLDVNREVGAIVDAPVAVGLAAATFDRDWAAAR